MNWKLVTGISTAFVLGAAVGAASYRATLPPQIQWELEFHDIEGPLALHRQEYVPKGQSTRFSSSRDPFDEPKVLTLYRPDTLQSFAKKDIAEVCLLDMGSEEEPGFFISIRFTPDTRARLLETLAANKDHRLSFRLGDSQLAHFYTDDDAIARFRTEVEQDSRMGDLDIYVDRDTLFAGFRIIHALTEPQPPRACYVEQNVFDIPHYREFVNIVWEDNFQLGPQ